MVGKRAEAFFVGFFLAGSIAGVLFVFFALRGGDTGFGASPREPAERASRREEEPRPPRPEPRPAGPRKAPEPETEPETPPEAPPEETADEERDEPPPGADGRAELVLELLRPKEDEDRRVVVSVVDEEGEAIEDALVVVRVGRQLVFRDRSDGDGVVVYDPYAEEGGPFRIDAIADRFAPAHAPDVRPGADTTLVLRMQPWIEGVVDAPTSGHGLVTLYTERGRRQTKIGADGSFLFEGVDPGWMTVQAEVEPYGADSESFQLRAGTRQFVRLKVRAKNRVKIFGEILGWHTDGKAWMNGARLAVTARGRYEFPKGVYGVNEVVIDVPAMAPHRERFVVEGRKAHRHDFKLENDAEIAGIVAAADTRVRLEGAEVRVGIDPEHPLNKDAALFPIELVPVVHTDDKGRFWVRRLKAGAQFTISIVKHPYAQFLGDFPAKNLGQHRILLPTGPFLYGRLQGLGGVPRNAKVTAYRLLEEPDPRRFNVPRWDLVTSGRDGKGYYGLGGLIPDLYVVRAEAPGYGAVETIVDLRDSGRGRMDLRIRKGQFQTSTDAELLKRLPPVVETAEEFGDQPRGDVTVLSIDIRRRPNEVPLPGVLVRFFEGELEFTAPMSFDEDRFELIRLPEATYRAVLSHPLLDKPIVRDGIRLQRGEPITIVFRE